eukprot:SAG22_NODE_260_length_13403_cov_57.915589_2_plen_72_part_00
MKIGRSSDTSFSRTRRILCQAQLVQMSDQLTATCCADSSNCQGGFPTECSAACAGMWNPFAATCSTYIEGE